MNTGTIQNPDQDLARTEARLPRWMAACAAAGAVALVAMGRFSFAAGFAVGAALSILSFLWLHQSIDSLFSSGQTHVPKRVVVKLLLRYPLAFGAVYLFYRTGWLPFMAIMAGFFVPLAGMLIEAVIKLSTGWRFTH